MERIEKFMLKQQRSDWIALVGRVFLATIFVASGLSKIPGWTTTVLYMEAKGIPWVPLFLYPAIFIEVIGGVCLLIGLKTRLAAGALFFYLIPVTLIFHNFWSMIGIEAQLQLINFLKNLSIMGGLAVTAAFGAGKTSVDGMLSRRKDKRKYDDTDVRNIRSA